jgi:hypothetical protein
MNETTIPRLSLAFVVKRVPSVHQRSLKTAWEWNKVYNLENALKGLNLRETHLIFREPSLDSNKPQIAFEDYQVPLKFLAGDGRNRVRRETFPSPCELKEKRPKSLSLLR